MTDYNILIAVLSKTTVLAFARIGKMCEVKAVEYVMSGVRPAVKELAGMLDEFKRMNGIKTVNLALFDADNDFSYTRKEVKVSDIENLQARASSKYELGDDTLIRLQAVKTSGGEATFQGTITRAELEEYSGLQEYGYNLIHLSSLMAAMTWRDVTKVDGVLVLSGGSKAALFSSRSSRVFDLQADTGRFVENLGAALGCDFAAASAALQMAGVWDTPDNRQELVQSGVDPESYYHFISDNWEPSFGKVRKLLESLKGQKSAISLRLGGWGAMFNGFSRWVSQTPVFAFDISSVKVTLADSLDVAGSEVELLMCVASVRDNIANFAKGRPMPDKADLEPTTVHAEPEEPRVKKVPVNTPVVKETRRVETERLVLETEQSADQISILVKNSITAVQVKRLNLINALLFFGIALVAVGVIGTAGAMISNSGRSVPADLESLKGSKADLMQLIDAKESYQQIGTRQIDKYLPYIEYIGMLPTNSVDISDFNLIGSASLRIIGSCASKDYVSFENGLHAIDTGLKVIISEKAQSTDKISFIIEITTGG